MRLIYGTGNPAKLRHMKDMLAPLPLEIAGINTVIGEVPGIDEIGNDPLENATIKAAAYYDILHQPVFSCDSGLYIEELDDVRQPGVHVRTVNGNKMTDDEMIAYYAAIARECGGRCHAVYRNAVYLKIDENHVYQSMGDELAGDPFILSAVPHPKRRDGFPLDSLSVEIVSGKYYYNLDARRVSSTTPEFLNFFRSVLQNIKLL
ncbi:MAG: hypothetical protein JW811_09295 [Clostridiales bacterium]|nr:hypothetical protein [Clostridiales bacterium]